MVTLPTKVLLATDGSEDAAAASRAAADLSKRLDAELYVVHAWRKPHEYVYPGVPQPIDAAAFSQRYAEETLRRERERLERMGAKIAESYLELGRPADPILNLGEQLGVGLIVMGSRGHGAFQSIVLGSVSEEVVHHAHCPVLVVRGGEHTWPPERIIIGDDGSEDANRAGDLAAGLGKLFGASVLLVRTRQEPPAPMELPLEQLELYERMVEENLDEDARRLARRAEEFESELGVRPETKVSSGNAAVILDKTAGENESVLIAVGARGLGAVRRMALGSVSTKILRAAKGPVLICPHSRL